MPGININDLPANLQQKLRPYAFIANDVDSAINMAKRAGTWTAEDDKAYTAFNGGKAWGQFDAFMKDTPAGLISQMSDEYFDALKNGDENPSKTAVAKVLAKEVERHPERFQPKTFKMASGRYVVYQRDKSTGKVSYKYYDANNKMMTEKQFKDAENLQSVSYDVQKGKLYAQQKPQGDGSKSWSEQSTGEKALTVLGGVLQVATLGFLTSCGDKEDLPPVNFIDETNVTLNANVINDNSSVTAALSTLAAYLAQIASLEAQIAENTGKNNELIAELKAEIQKLRAEIEAIKGHLVTIITNQESSAQTAEQYFKLILNAIGDNSELLAIVVDQLTEGNTTLKEIKKLMEQNNADNKEILEAITKCKYGIDQLHEDNEEIKKLLAQINEAINRLPDNLKDKFSGYFKQIILGIADNGAKLDALTNLLKVVNQNIVAGNTAILNKLDKIQVILDKLFNKFSEFDAKTTNMLNAIATAIANMAAKIDKLDLSKIEKTLSEILDKIGQNGQQMADMTKLLELINNNVVLNGERQEKILEAINKLGQYGVQITGQLTEIINRMGTNTTKLDELITLLQTMDANNGERNQKLIEAINALGAFGVQITGQLNTIIAQMGCNSTKLDKLIELLKTMDANNEARNKAILEAIAEVNGNMVAGFTGLIEIGKENNALQTETNNLINVAIELLKKLPGGAIDLDKLIEAVNNNTVAINKQGGNANVWLQKIYSLLETLNANVENGNENNNIMMGKILAAISNKVDTPDFSKILEKLDSILQAIKDHKVKVEVDGTITCGCGCGNNGTHEGVIDDLNWLLG